MPTSEQDMRRVLSTSGEILPGAQAPEIPQEDLLKLFDTMLLVRIVDDRMMRLQRQGRLGFYMKSLGEEASHMAVYALRNTDWVFPSYREQGAWFWAGYPVKNFIDQLFGVGDDPCKGRQMPVHHSADWLNYVSISSPVGTQIPQAVGTAMAMKMKGTDNVAVTYFGEGTSSTGAFHVGMNFAGVHKAPVVFICRNNGWAISTGLDKQTAAKSFASKAVGYGMPGILVDGNDILATIKVTQEAVARARKGDGPTMIEAVTYRVEGHSSSDDPSVYRPESEPEEWSERDPLSRFRRYLLKIGLLTEAVETQLAEHHNNVISEAIENVGHKSAPELLSLFDDVYEDIPWHINEQKDYLMEQLRTKSPHNH